MIKPDIFILRRTGHFHVALTPIIMSLVEWMQLEKDDPVFFGEINRGITLWEKPIDERGF